MKCFAATNAFWIDPQGYTLPCARNKKQLEHITSFKDFSDIQSSEGFEHIRTQLAMDKFPSSCFRCETDEKQGVRSKRQYYDEAGMNAPDDFMIDLSLGNFCNLKCRMCSPINSTSWANDYDQLISKKLVPALTRKVNAYNLTDENVDALIKFIATVTGNIFIEFKGGEPLLIPHTKKLMDKLLTLHNRDKITLLVITNGTKVPAWLKEAAKHIKELQLIVSIDGINSLYDYIRGSDKVSYESCISNIEKFALIDGINLRFNVVVQNLNMHQLPEIHDTLMKYDRPINWIKLHLPEYLAPNIMPTDARTTIHKKLTNYDFGKYTDKLTPIIDLLEVPATRQELQTFLEVTRTLDKLRNESLESVAPHLLGIT